MAYVVVNPTTILLQQRQSISPTGRNILDKQCITVTRSISLLVGYQCEFQIFNYESTSWRLDHKRVLCAKLDILVFIPLIDGNKHLIHPYKLCLVSPVLQVSLDCPLLIANCVLYIVYLYSMTSNHKTSLTKQSHIEVHVQNMTMRIIVY